MLALSAAEVFFASANAAYTASLTAPQYVTYRVHSKLNVVHGEREFDSHVSVRTKDQLAVVTDGQSHEVSLREPYPAPPTLDPLSTFDWSVMVSISRAHRLRATMRDITPLHYERVASSADVVVRTSKDYVIAFTDGTSDAGDRIHLLLEPTNAMRRRSKLWLTELVVERATMQPVLATYRQKGQGNSVVTLTVEYRRVAGHLLLSTLHYYANGSVALFGHVTIELTCEYADYTFPVEPPDPRLATAGMNGTGRRYAPDGGQAGVAERALGHHERRWRKNHGTAMAAPTLTHSASTTRTTI